MHIRELVASDAGQYTALRLHMLREFAEAFASGYEEDSVGPRSWVRKRLSPRKVAPEQMSRGVGRVLLDACLQRARGIPGQKQINLTVTSTNPRAARMHEAAGFRGFGVEERALKIDGACHPKAHMVAYLAHASLAVQREYSYGARSSSSAGTAGGAAA